MKKKMFVLQSKQLLVLLLVCLARLIVAELVCRPSYGVAILNPDCQHALWDLSTVSIQDNIWEAPRIRRRFSRDSAHQRRDRMPQGFSSNSCSIGIDILDPPPGTQQPRYVDADWVDLWRELLELVRRCVVEYGLGGSQEAHGFSFTIINPNTGLGEGLCMAPNRDTPMDMGRCIAQRAMEVGQTQATHGDNFRPVYYPADSRESHTRPQERLSWSSGTLGGVSSQPRSSAFPQRATISDLSGARPPTDDSDEVQSPLRLPVGEDVQPPASTPSLRSASS